MDKLVLPRGLEQMKTAPIFYISSHGWYDMDKEPESFIVPENTFVFESASITDITCTTIDVPLWNLISGKNRYWFLKYLLGEASEVDPNKEDNLKLFKSLHFYEPGDTIYVRTLDMEGGRGERNRYETFGFYGFPIESNLTNMPSRGERRPNSQIKPLNPLRNSLIAPALHWNKPGPPQEVVVTNAEIIIGDKRGFFNTIGEPAIFIFSSCGSVRCESVRKPICDKRVALIEQHQYNQDLKATEKGILTPIVIGKDPSGNITIKPRHRACKNSRSCLVAADASNSFTELAQNEPDRSVPVKAIVGAPHGSIQIYEIELIDPSKPFPPVLAVDDIKKIVNVSNGTSHFFNEAETAALIREKATNPRKFGTGGLYKMRLLNSRMC